MDIVDNQNLILEIIEECLLPRLEKAIDDSEMHAEFGLRERKLNKQFPILIKKLNCVDLSTEKDIASVVLPKLIILDLELRSDGPWFIKKCKECSSRLNQTFDMKYGFKLTKLLANNGFFSTQFLFDKCIEDLHNKLTSATFKNYPALLEVYCNLVTNVKNYYKIKLNPMTVLPLSLLLIDDYNIGNKIKGLKSCSEVLDCLRSNDFSQGNYYEVIYECLKKCLFEKDLEVTQLTLPCLLDLLQIIPSEVQIAKTDEVYKIILDELSVESNLYRKAACFEFMRQIIEILGVHCVKRDAFKTVVCDALDSCSTEAAAEILLQEVLECMAVWMKFCWCVWKLSCDQNMLKSLFKILLVMSEDEKSVRMVRNLVLTMIQLCSKDEQTHIFNNMVLFTDSQSSNEKYLSHVEEIKRSICV